MKKKGILVAACLVFCGLFVTQPAFAALYSGAWEAAANGTLTTTEYGDSEFGFYDYNNEDNYYGLSNGVNTFSVSGNQVTVFSATDAKTDTLTFSLNDGSVEFGFYMKEANGSTITFFKEADVVYDADFGLHVLSFGDDSSKLLVYASQSEVSGGDVNHTPVPTAALLLGSGLVGLVGFRRKTGQN